jgi:hypothetical protein
MINDKIAITNPKHIMKTEYFKAYGQRGKRTTAMIPNRIVGNSQVFGSAVSNLNEANFDVELFSDFAKTFGYFNLGIFYGLWKYITSASQHLTKSSRTESFSI